MNKQKLLEALYRCEVRIESLRGNVNAQRRDLDVLRHQREEILHMLQGRRKK